MLGLVVSFSSCKLFSKNKRDTVDEVQEPITEIVLEEQESTDPVEESVVQRPHSIEANPSKNLKKVFFEYDSSVIGPDAQEVLLENLAWIQKHPDIDILIEGHCDERGTIQYNLSLGEKRALSVVDFFVRHGIDRKRLYTISYGEEQPLDSGYGEDHWKKNRRVEFKRYE